MKSSTKIDNKQTFGHRVRMMRETLGLSLDGLSEKCQISKGHLSQIENGKVDVSLSKAILIAKFLNSPLSSLIDEWIDEDYYLKSDEIVLLEMYRERLYANILKFVALAMEGELDD